MNKIYNKLKNNKIIKLDLNNNKIKNINKLGKSLKYNNSLTYLDLNFNKIENIDKLAYSLIYNTSLTYLDLADNYIENIDKNKIKQINKNIIINI